MLSLVHALISVDPWSWWRHQMETFPPYWPFVREFTGQRRIPLTKASDAELWYFVWSASEKKKRLSKQSSAGDLRRHLAHFTLMNKGDIKESMECELTHTDHILLYFNSSSAGPLRNGGISAAVTCGKLWPDYNIIFQERLKFNFTRFG